MYLHGRYKIPLSILAHSKQQKKEELVEIYEIQHSVFSKYYDCCPASHMNSPHSHATTHSPFYQQPHCVVTICVVNSTVSLLTRRLQSNMIVTIGYSLNYLHVICMTIYKCINKIINVNCVLSTVGLIIHEFVTCT